MAVNGSRVYVSFNFSTSGPDLMEWNGTAWNSMACPIYANKLAFGHDGSLYAAGVASSTAATSYAALAVYSGGGWQTVYSGTDVGQLMCLFKGKNSMYIGGWFEYFNGVPLVGSIYEYANKTVRPVDINNRADGTDRILCGLERKNGEVWTAGYWTRPVTAPSVNVQNNGSSKSYPFIRFTGPGTLWQVKNYTTGSGLYFNGLVLQAGETAILDLRPGQVRFDSSWRGGLLKYLMPGSNLDLFLQSGSNNLSCHITGSTTATTAQMSFGGRYWSIDAAAR